MNILHSNQNLILMWNNAMFLSIYHKAMKLRQSKVPTKFIYLGELLLMLRLLGRRMGWIERVIATLCRINSRAWKWILNAPFSLTRSPDNILDSNLFVWKIECGFCERENFHPFMSFSSFALFSSTTTTHFIVCIFHSCKSALNAKNKAINFSSEIFSLLFFCVRQKPTTKWN